MNNNDRYNNILAIISITKFATLLFILIIIFNAPHNEMNYIDSALLNFTIADRINIELSDIYKE